MAALIRLPLPRLRPYVNLSQSQTYLSVLHVIKTINVPAAPAIRRIPLLVAPALRRAANSATIIRMIGIIATREPACRMVNVPESPLVNLALKDRTKSATARMVPASSQKTVGLAP